MQVYQFSEFQRDHMVRCCNDESFPIWEVRIPSLADSPADRAFHATRLNEMADLILLGLAKDVTPSFAETIEMVLEVTGRHVRMMTLTLEGFDLFNNASARTVQ